jgi:hypothetical protein
VDGIDIAAGYSAVAAQSVRVEASTAVLAKAMKADANAAAILLDAMPAPASLGSVGQNLDVRA